MMQRVSKRWPVQSNSMHNTLAPACMHHGGLCSMPTAPHCPTNPADAYQAAAQHTRAVCRHQNGGR